MLALFSTSESSQKEAPSVNVGSILSSMTPLAPKKTLNRSNTDDLLDFSKELTQQEKFLAAAREAKEKILAEKQAKRFAEKIVKRLAEELVKSKSKKSKNKEEDFEKKTRIVCKSSKTYKTKSHSNTNYIHPSHLPKKSVKQEEEVSDDYSEISYLDDDVPIKKRPMEEKSSKAHGSSSKERAKSVKPKTSNILTVNHATSPKSTTASRSPSPMPNPSRESNIKTKVAVPEKSNTLQPKEKKDEKKSDYLQKLYNHREASEKALTSDKKPNKEVFTSKKEIKRDVPQESSSKTNKPNESISSGKRPLVKPSSKEEPQMMKKNLVGSKYGTSLKTSQVEQNRSKHSKLRAAPISEDEDEDDSFIDDDEYEQRDCEEMESYRKMIAAYRRKTEMRRHLERDIRNMEATFEELQREDKKTAMIGRMEDDVELVAINKERKMEMERRHQKSKSRKI